MILLILILVFLFVASTKYITKNEIAKMYGICRKTLRKWLQYICPDSFEYWMKYKKFNLFDLIHLESVFGSPNEKSYTKRELLEECSTDYKTLRENVALKSRNWGISENTYSKIDILPPSISRRIIEEI